MTEQLARRSAKKTWISSLLIWGLAWTIQAAVRYVNVSNPAPVIPYTSWATAATNLQDAVDVANPGDDILVTNGVYRTGGRAITTQMTNRVAVTKPVKVRSVNGPGVTVIQGAWAPGGTNGDGAVRCAYLVGGALLAGFTLTNGATRATGDIYQLQSGGAVWCVSATAVVSNCVLVGNSASDYGGGAYQGTLTNCTLSGNVAYNGGGAYSAYLNNCLLLSNSASGYGGGASWATLSNCTLSGNSALYGGGADNGTANNCTLTGNCAQNSGGGACFARLNNSSVCGNSARFGGGAYSGTLSNCTVVGNWALGYGGGTHASTLNNCLVYYNRAASAPNYNSSTLNYCCTQPLPGSGTGNIDAEPQLVSAAHVSSGSPCRGAGSTAYAKGRDIDAEPWANPPSIGCDEFYAGSATGALSVRIQASYSNVTAGFSVNLAGEITGRAAASTWDFGDGVVVSNQPFASHSWATPGDYTVTLRAYNDSNPEGASAEVRIQVVEQPVYYVVATNSAPAAPFTSWATAATNIQDAVDMARMAGALILVQDGVYRAGGRAVNGMLSNRVAVTLPVVLKSVNGPEATIIEGCQVPGSTNGDSAVRCVYLAEGAVLAGFTLRNGATRTAGDAYQEQCGGGVWCGSGFSVVSNCVLKGNAAAYLGGGAYCGTLYGCVLVSNAATSGGGAYLASLNSCMLAGNLASGNGGGAASGMANNCTLTGNSAQNSGGGAYYGTLNNCIIYYNQATNTPNYVGSLLNYCVTTPLPTNGTANLAVEPQLASASHLSDQSPCRGAGSTAYAVGTDLDGEAWATPPSIGCDEPYSGAATGPITLSIQASRTRVLAGFRVEFTAGIAGALTASRWDFGDGTVVSNQPYASHTWTAVGDYPVSLWAYNASHPGGISTTVLVQVIPQPIHYVAADSASPLAPYSSWATAARNIQDAVDAATVPGAMVLVSNGVYNTGGRAVFGTMTNRVVVAKSVVLQSVAGPAVTTIQGCQVPGTTSGDLAVRCVYLSGGSLLAGFTLMNGATRASGDLSREQSGGAVWCASNSEVISNCVLTANAAATNGGGAYLGTLRNCTLVSNQAFFGGGAYSANLSNCSVTGCAAYMGGGAYAGTLVDCMLVANSAATNGGGVYASSLTNCTVSGSFARYGGGTYLATLTGCVLVSNSVTWSGGGAYGSTLKDCTLIGNYSDGVGGGAYGGSLTNCTLATNSAYYNGGAAYTNRLDNCALLGNSANTGGGAYSSTLNRCALLGNSASYAAGGAYGGTLNNCLLVGNAASSSGGGASSSALNNCTLTGNSAARGGGASYATLTNCIAYYNRATLGGPNHDSCTITYSCTTPLPGGGAGNLDIEPALASASHLSAVSPCRGAGNAAYVIGTDIDGDSWEVPPSMGCDEPVAGRTSGRPEVSLQMAYTNVAAGFSLDLLAQVNGVVSASRWEFGDGIVISNRPYISHSWSGPGDYAVVARAYNEAFPEGVSATGWVHVVEQPVHYVAANGNAPLAPYVSWNTAATNLQDAVDAATVPGALVLVTNGLYANGGRVVYGALSNRLAVTKALVIQSVNGPEVTRIQGNQMPGTNNGDGAVRCVLLTEGATLAGFTLQYGATRAAGDYSLERSGGGLWCAGPSALVSNCIILGNAAHQSGGGVYCGTLKSCVLASNLSAYSGGGASSATLDNCRLVSNSASNSGAGAAFCTLNNCLLTSNAINGTFGGAFGGGAYSSSLSNCVLIGNCAPSGGGVASSTLNYCILRGNSAIWGGGCDGVWANNCILTSNSATGGGGGVDGGTLCNCLLIENSAPMGGGASDASLFNCTIVTNSASSYGGGVDSCWLYNCIAYFNQAPNAPNYSGALYYCCTAPLPAEGSGNFTNAPLLVDLAAGNYHLQSNSPCINAGRTAYARGAADLDGNARITGGRVDVGAYELPNPVSQISYAWLQQFALVPGESTDTADPDGDGMNNWQEWIAGTDPTNAASAFKLITPVVGGSGVRLAWTSVPNRTYCLERASNAATVSTFSVLKSNIAGLVGTTSFTDSNATSIWPSFYRVRVDPE